MVYNPEYDLSRPLASALRAKAPYVGIPIPGHAPLIFNRLFLWRALKGVTPVNVEVQVLENGERLLIVDGVAGERRNGNVVIGRVRHHMKMRSLHRGRRQDKQLIEEAMEKWKPALAVKASPAPRISKYDKAIAKLERQLARLGSRPQIANPCLTHSAVPESWRDTWLKWRNQKRLRGQIGAAANAGKTSKELYTALRALGLERLRTFSELNTAERRSLTTRDEEDERRGWKREGTYLDYAKPENLWRFQRGLVRERPRLWGEDYFAPESVDLDESGGRIPRWGAARYNVILEWSRNRRELLSQIEGIRQMETPGPP